MTTTEKPATDELLNACKLAIAELPDGEVKLAMVAVLAALISLRDDLRKHGHPLPSQLVRYR